ncbi:MAG: hypothetical protein RJA10_483 [Pseudomonadota bacterium]|jgi:uncharacterized protein (TIGR04222 family)
MFPFNLAGPAFLVFYAVFAVVVLVAYGVWLRHLGAAAAGGVTIDSLTADPYRIACLRAGPDEAVKLAVVNLIDRGLLADARGEGWRATRKADPGLQRRSLDRVVLGQCQAVPLSADEVLADRAVRKAATEIEADLKGKGLLLTTPQRGLRGTVRLAVVALLWGLPALRLWQALSREQTHVEYLMMMAVVAGLIALALPREPLTPAGRRALQSVTSLLGRLKSRAEQIRPGGATNEAVLCAAAFGLYVLPAAAFPFIEQVYPQPARGGDSGGGGDGGSSSSDSSCGGGGGCGGCGGGGD